MSAVCADSGERQTARVKQRRRNVVKESAVRNRMVDETSRATISTGYRRWGKRRAKGRGKRGNEHKGFTMRKIGGANELWVKPTGRIEAWKYYPRIKNKGVRRGGWRYREHRMGRGSRITPALAS